MKFSVVIPNYDRYDRLARLLHRLDISRFPKDEFEVIIVDAGTKPGRLHFSLDRFDGMNIVAIDTHHPQWQNPAWPRNRGYREACGKYALMLDVDYFPSEYLLAEFERSHKENDFVFGYAVCSSRGDRPFKVDHDDEPIRDAFQQNGIPRTHWSGEAWLYSITRGTLEYINGYDEDYEHGWGREDSDIYRRLTQGLRLAAVKNPDACVICEYHEEAGHAGQRDSTINDKVLASKDPKDVKRNLGREWGAPRESEIIHDYRQH